MKYTGFPLRYQFSVVELKRDKAKPEDVTQVINYSKWVSGRLANSELETVRPVLIAYDFDKKTIDKANSSDFNDRGIRLVKYEVKDADLIFRSINEQK